MVWISVIYFISIPKRMILSLFRSLSRLVCVSRFYRNMLIHLFDFVVHIRFIRNPFLDTHVYLPNVVSTLYQSVSGVCLLNNGYSKIVFNTISNHMRFHVIGTGTHIHARTG